MLDFIKEELKVLNKAGLIRDFRTISAIKGSRVKIDGKWYISFCTNDYLGLSQHPHVIKAAQKALKDIGWGSGASRLMAGTFSYHKELEKTIARFKNAETALLFTSGYAVNLGVITTLITDNDIIFCDQLNHASLVDAARLTKARLHIYRHRNVEHLEEMIKKECSCVHGFMSSSGHLTRQHVNSLTRKLFIISDAIFSMDGDAAPLADIVRLAKKYNAIIILDEAHSTGILGKNGRGLAEKLGLEKKVDISIGTMSKAVGGIGGFVAGDNDLISYLKSKSRPFIFTTALPPAACAANIEALNIVKHDKTLRKNLWDNTAYVKIQLKKYGFDFRGSETPIIPIMIGDAKKTLEVSQHLWKQSLFIPAIRPPTVPVGESRLRITITAMHSRKELDLLLKYLRAISD
jgi:glycine C-acetyltransferase/8-amino-7-oxononanoate synthase